MKAAAVIRRAKREGEVTRLLGVLTNKVRRLAGQPNSVQARRLVVRYSRAIGAPPGLLSDDAVALALCPASRRLQLEDFDEALLAAASASHAAALAIDQARQARA